MTTGRRANLRRSPTWRKGIRWGSSRDGSVFNFTPRLFATLGDQFVRPHLRRRSDATEVFLCCPDLGHPGFDHVAGTDQNTRRRLVFIERSEERRVGKESRSPWSPY